MNRICSVRLQCSKEFSSSVVTMWLLLWSCVIGCISHSLSNSLYRPWPFPDQPQPQDASNVLPWNQFQDESNLEEDLNSFHPDFFGPPAKSLPSRVVLLTYKSTQPQPKPGGRHYVFQSDGKEINLEFEPNLKDCNKGSSEEEDAFWVGSQGDRFGSSGEEVDKFGVSSEEDRSGEETTEDLSSKKGVTLDYKPSRPFYHPNPGNNIGQIVPSGKPWPDKPDDYTRPTTRRPPTPPATKPTTSSTYYNINERFGESTTTIKPSPAPVTGITLEYKPSRPSFHPNPGNLIGQIVPPGKPWPANPEDYPPFSTVPTTTLVDLNDRLGEGTEPTNRPQVTGITLDYKPSRPSYQPNPGYFVGQIVQPGKPWPASAEEYPSYMATRPTRRTPINRNEPQANEMVPPADGAFFEPNLRDGLLTQTASRNATGEEVVPPKEGESPTNSKLFIPVPSLGHLFPNGFHLLPTQSTATSSKPTTISGQAEVTTSSNPTTNQPEGEITIPTNNQPETINNQATGTTLIYKPQRPPYHPYPDDPIVPLVPPGDPWPANPLNYTQNGSTETQFVVNDMMCSDKSCLHTLEVSKATDASDVSYTPNENETENKETAATMSPSDVSPNSAVVSSADSSSPLFASSSPSADSLNPSEAPSHSSEAPSHFSEAPPSHSAEAPSHSSEPPSQPSEAPANPSETSSNVSDASSSLPTALDVSSAESSSSLPFASSNPSEPSSNPLDAFSNASDESSTPSVATSSLPAASSASPDVSSTESNAKSSSVLPLQLLNSGDQAAEVGKIDTHSTEPAPFTSESRAAQVKKKESEETTLNNAP